MNDQLDSKWVAELRREEKALDGDQAFVDRVMSRWEQDQSPPERDAIVASLRFTPWRALIFPGAVAALIAGAIGVSIFAHAQRKPPRQPDPVAQLMAGLHEQIDLQPRRARHAMDQVKAMLDVTQLLQAIDALPGAPDPAELIEPDAVPEASEI